MKIRLFTIRRDILLGFGMLWLAAGPCLSCQAGESPPAASTPAAAQGRALYLMNCAHCHGLDATGDEGPDLHGLDLPDERVANLVKYGKKQQMPGFGAKLDRDQIQFLIAYLHTLK
jgi:mono/diheme cytochrome c family protein